MVRHLVIFATFIALAYSSPVRDVELDFLERQAQTIEPTALAPASPQPPSVVTIPALFSTAEPSPSTTTTATATPSSSTTSTPTPTPSTTVTATPSSSITATPTPSASVTTSPGSSRTPTPSVTPSISTSPSQTPTPSITPSVSVSSSVTPTVSASGIASPSPSGGALPLELTETSPPASTAAPRPPCFPASATVELEDGSLKKMGDLSVGDRVAVGGGKFSEVFMFTHKLANVKQDFVQIVTEAGPALRLTAGHYLPVNGRYQPAKTAVVGDLVELATGQSTRISAVSTVQDTGLFNPQTTHGDVIVDGVLCSTYTTAVPRGLAHAALAPLRAVCQRLGLYFSFLESGADRVARLTSTLA